MGVFLKLGHIIKVFHDKDFAELRMSAMALLPVLCWYILLHHGVEIANLLYCTICFKLGAKCISVFTNGSKVGFLPDANFP